VGLTFAFDFQKGSDGYPIWGVVYYCIRSGKVDAAIEYAHSVPTLQDLIPYLRSLTRREQSALHPHFRVPFA